MTKQKNHHLLLNAFANIERPDARLMLLGQGDCEESLRELSAELDITERVIFAGFHSDPSPFYSSADVFALSSNYEGLPTVLIEALGYGLPIVSTDCPSGPVEILNRGQFGRLVSMEDINALSCAIDAALDEEVDPDFLKRRAADFSPEAAALRYLDSLAL